MRLKLFSARSYGIDENGELWARRDWEKLEPGSDEWIRALKIARLEGLDMEVRNVLEPPPRES